MKRMIIMAMTLILLMSSIGVMTDLDTEADGTPTRARYRQFEGWIEGLNISNPDGVPGIYGLNVSAQSGTPPVKQPANQADVYLNATHPGNFSVQVDIDSHDSAYPWIFDLVDAYGWNETNGGEVSVPDPDPWPPAVYTLPNGTLGYYKGEFGNLSITMINGSSGEPLPGVAFRFERHPFHSTLSSGNVTDASGDVRFDNLQMGLDFFKGEFNLVKLYIIMGNFTYDDGNGTGIAYLPVHVNTTTHYTLTIEEDPLVRSSSPSPEDNTGIPVDKDRVPNDVFVQFFDEIDQSTVDIDTLYLQKMEGEKVNITYQWPTNDICKIRPNEDLEYNTTYEVVVKPGIRNTTGYPQLWRTFRFNFTTELSPAVLRCQVVIEGTSDPAPEGSMIRLDSSLPQPLEDGFFQFDSVLPTPGGHTITVVGPTVNGTEEYLYYGNSVSGIMVERGKVIDVPGLFVTKRPVREAQITIADEQENPVFGANVIHKVTGEEQTTDITGTATFDEILVESNTGFWINYPNFEDDSITIPNGTTDPVQVTKVIFEKDLPIVVKARSDFTIDLEPGTIINVDSKIQIDFETMLGTSLDMNSETMTTDNLKILDELLFEVPLDIESTPGDASRWILAPRDLLDYDTNYTIFISEAVASTDGKNPLWRDFELTVRTEALDDSTVSGTVMVRGRGVGGVEIQVLQGEVVKASGVTSENGGFVLPVKHDEFTLTNITVKADGTDVGLSTETIELVNLNAGGTRESVDFDLSRLAEWFQAQYPKDSEGRMPVTGTFTLKFKVALDHSDMDTFVDNFTLRNPEMDINVTVSQDGRTVIIDPVEPLDYDKIYTLSVGADFADEFYRELRDVNGSYALPRGEVIQIKTEFKPVEVILQTPSSNLLNNVQIDTPITIFFTNYSVDTALVENAFEFKDSLSGEPVGNLTFTWTLEDQKVEIEHDDLEGSTEYSIFLPADKYGSAPNSGAMVRDDFLVYFTTVPVMMDVPVVKQWPQSVKSGGNMVATLENPLGYTISVAILLEEVRGSGNYIQKVNVTLEAGETDRQIEIDVKDLDPGDYQAEIRVYDISKDPIVLLDQKPINVLIEEDDDSGSGSLLWVFIVIGAIVILIAILAVFLIAQSRKKDIEEELKEEFECPECHHLVSEDDTVCPHCGAEFEEQAYKCPKCGSMLDPEDEECPECGYDFSDQDQMELEDDEDEDLEDMELEEEEEEEDLEIEEEEEEMEEEED